MATTNDASPPATTASSAPATAPSAPPALGYECKNCGHSEQKAKPKFTCPICKTIFHVCNKDCQKEFWCQHRKEHREQARAVGVGMDNLSSDSAAVTTGKFDGVARTETEHEEQKDELEAAFHRPEYVYREPADSRKRIEALQQLQASQYLINQFYGYCLEHKERFQHRAYSGSESRERECRSKARQLFDNGVKDLVDEKTQAGFLFNEAMHFCNEDPSRALDQLRLILDRYPHSTYALDARIWIQDTLEGIGESTHAEGLLIYQEMLAAEGLDIMQKSQLWSLIYNGRILAAEWAKAEEVAREALLVLLEDDYVDQSETIRWVRQLSNILAIQDKVEEQRDLHINECPKVLSDHKVDLDGDCMVCLEKMGGDDEGAACLWIFTACHHSVHFKCYGEICKETGGLRIFGDRMTCPLCRRY